jgi:leader peptidase (prepilin peptidase)/N-methyltransferase
VSGVASGDVAAAVVGAAVGLVGGFLGPRVIARLPEPELDPEPTDEAAEPRGRLQLSPVHDKIPYVDLARRPRLGWWLALGAALAGAVLAGVLGWSVDLLVVLPLVPVGVWLGYVDWRTTFLPTRIIAPTYGVLVVAILVAALVQDDRSDALRAVGGWACYGGYFLLMWLIAPGVGYGDVRLSGVLGLVLGWLGWAELFVGMFAGLLLGGIGGALLALLRIVPRGRNPFGPHMLAGAALAAMCGPWVATQLGY